MVIGNEINTHPKDGLRNAIHSKVYLNHLYTIAYARLQRNNLVGRIQISILLYTRRLTWK